MAGLKSDPSCRPGEEWKGWLWVRVNNDYHAVNRDSSVRWQGKLHQQYQHQLSYITMHVFPFEGFSFYYLLLNFWRKWDVMSQWWEWQIAITVSCLLKLALAFTMVEVPCGQKTIIVGVMIIWRSYPVHLSTPFHPSMYYPLHNNSWRRERSLCFYISENIHSAIKFSHHHENWFLHFIILLFSCLSRRGMHSVSEK